MVFIVYKRKQNKNFFGIFLMIFCITLCINGGDNESQEIGSIEIYNSVKMLIDYFKRNQGARTPDAMIGFHFLKMQLESIIQQNFQFKNEIIAFLQHIYTDTVELLSLNEAKIPKPNNIFAEIVIQQIKNNDLWQSNMQSISNFQYGHFFENSTNCISTFEDLQHRIDIGQPTPLQSDQCLAEILNTELCTISKKCSVDTMSVNTEAHGYHLTHKLFYYIILNQRKCSAILSPDVSTETLISKLCTDILVESRLIADADFPYIYRDLFIEQVFLCAFNGFAEFLNETWIQQIFQWQNSIFGCYQYATMDNQITSNVNENVQKRSVTILENDCSDHMSGLAAAAIGTIIKFGVEQM